MGLLSEGSPLTWEETKALSDHVRKHGIAQFINLYHRLKNRQGDVLKWGDEVEYILVKFDHEKKQAKVSLRADELLNILRKREEEDPQGVKCLWRPEYGAYMIEGTPGQPYGGLTAHYNVVEANMHYRREEVQKLLEPNEVLMTVTSFPRLGCRDFTDPKSTPTPTEGSAQSLFFPDAAIYPGHPRFKTLTSNIRQRRGEKVCINLPIFKDENTPSPYLEVYETAPPNDPKATEAAKPDHVYLDAMGFGMGCCCLQVTFQACNINEARTLYDQLTPLCPILVFALIVVFKERESRELCMQEHAIQSESEPLPTQGDPMANPSAWFVGQKTQSDKKWTISLLALTAASPIQRGHLTDVDCRWNVISGSVDCRTREERGLEPLKNNKFVIPKSRYDSIDSYLSEQGEKYNDVPLVYDKAIYDELRAADIDHLLAQHIAHLFIRDSVSLFREKLNQNDEEDMDHFENIQSTNWQTMRFKPPPPHSSIGWRVEFRPCEVQITDFENAAVVCFIVLLTRVILSYHLNLIIPISKVDENMQNAQKRNALKTERFWFRKDITTFGSPPACTAKCQTNCEADCYTPMTIDQIINGKEGEFPGLIALINSYLSGMDVDADTHCSIQQYLKLIQRRASGELLTTASWMRNFVQKHPEYKKDSIVSEIINYDLLMEVNAIQSGIKACPELLGRSLKSRTQESIPPAVQKAAGIQVNGEQE